MTSPVKKPVAYAIAAAVGRHMVVAAAHPDGVESYASQDQKHLGFFADDPIQDPAELEGLRLVRDALVEALQKIIL